jgi:hypothetical protein
MKPMKNMQNLIGCYKNGFFNTKFMTKISKGSDLVSAAWIVKRGERFPRLTNTYPVKK